MIVVIKIYKVLLVAISLMLIAGCLSEVEIDLPENTSDSIAISAQLVKGESSNIIVKITGLASFVGFSQPELIDDAIVELHDENGYFILVPNLIQGYYSTVIESLPIETGTSYQLKINVNGKNYESALEMLHAVPKATGITHSAIVRSELNRNNNIVDNSYLQFYIDSPLTTPSASEKSYLKWDYDAVYRFIESDLGTPFAPPAETCYYTQRLNLDKISIFNGPESRSTNLTGELLLEEALDHRFSRGFYLNAYQQSLSKSAYEYWEQVQAITDLSGNFFEDPPGKIVGNFTNPSDPSEEVFGYFYASELEVVRVLVKQEDYLISPICPAVASPENTSIRRTCFDCLLQPNSTFDKPIWWVE